jgi:hypothetical protein
MSEKSPASWVVCNANDGGSLNCLRCGDSYAMTYPVDVMVACATMNAYVDRHRNCEELDDPYAGMVKCGTFKIACSECYDLGKKVPHRNNDDECPNPRMLTRNKPVGQGISVRTICECEPIPCPNGCPVATEDADTPAGSLADGENVATPEGETLRPVDVIGHGAGGTTVGRYRAACKCGRWAVMRNEHAADCPEAS